MVLSQRNVSKKKSLLFYSLLSVFLQFIFLFIYFPPLFFFSFFSF